MSVLTYYNEFDAKAAAWLRELAAKGHIHKGMVDETSIKDIKAGHIQGLAPQRAHFFAGIGGWDYALKLAGWPESAPVWTGSCPCQPFSIAGKRKGVEDERHLWPDFAQLIKKCRPPVVFGEQVTSADGREWLTGVRADLERMGYAVGAADLCAAGIGAPHIRQRLYWVAYAPGQRLNVFQDLAKPHGRPGSDAGRGAGRLADPQRDGARRGPGHGHGPGAKSAAQGGRQAYAGLAETGHRGAARGMGQPSRTGLEGREVQSHGQERQAFKRAGRSIRHWDACELLPCKDNKFRRVEPGSFPLAYGAPERVGRLRGYGNAIVPHLAAVFVRAFMDAVL